MLGTLSYELGNESVEIRSVWEDNLLEEMRLIIAFANNFPYVALDTEFPVKAFGKVRDPKLDHYERNYQEMRRNVNNTQLIQLGLTLFDENGNLPSVDYRKYSVWEFNFRGFDPRDDGYKSESIQLLINSGIDFERNNQVGVVLEHFAVILMSSGILMNNRIRWLTFHGLYDFGYLVRLLSARALPETSALFLQQVRFYFPVLFDVKHLILACDNLHGGLQRIADILGVKRVGTSHNAGSDSLLTSGTYIRLRERFFNNVPPWNMSGVLFGLRY